MITPLRRLLRRLRPKPIPPPAPPRVIIINAHTRRYHLLMPPQAAHDKRADIS